MEIRHIAKKDRQPLDELLGRIETFSPQERLCALELIDHALEGTDKDYEVRIAERDGKVIGYVCYGPTPMTEGTYDLYWIASDPTVRGQGVGAALVSAREGELPVACAEEWAQASSKCLSSWSSNSLYDIGSKIEITQTCKRNIRDDWR